MFTTDTPATLEDLHRADPDMAPPRKKSAWRPLPHHEMVTAALDACVLRGWVPGPVTAHLGRLGADMVARFDVGKPHGDGTVLCVGLANSNAQQFQPKVYVGLRRPDTGVGLPFVSDNLGRHRVGGTPLDNLRDFIDVLTAAQITRENGTLLLWPYPEASAEQLGMWASRNHLITGTRMLKMLSMWSLGRPTLGRLLWAFAETTLKAPPIKQMENAYRFKSKAVSLKRRRVKDGEMAGTQDGGGGVRDAEGDAGRHRPEVFADEGR